MLFGKLGSSDLWKFAHHKQVQTELKKWQKTLKNPCSSKMVPTVAAELPLLYLEITKENQRNVRKNNFLLFGLYRYNEKYVYIFVDYLIFIWKRIN